MIDYQIVVWFNLADYCLQVITPLVTKMTSRLWGGYLFDN